MISLEYSPEIKELFGMDAQEETEASIFHTHTTARDKITELSKSTNMFKCLLDIIMVRVGENMCLCARLPI